MIPAPTKKADRARREPRLAEPGEALGLGPSGEPSGVAEVIGGLAVLVPATRRLSGLWLVALLAAVFPANLYMAREPERFSKVPRWALYARLPLQPLCMLWAWKATRR